LEGELGPLEKALQPPQDLRVGQRQLLQRAVPDLGRELVQLRVELRREGLLELLLDLSVDAAEMVDRTRFRTDPPSFIQDLAGDPGDPQESLWVEREPRGRDRVGRLCSRFGSLRVIHPSEITPNDGM
jgi:hypothetical protein